MPPSPPGTPLPTRAGSPVGPSPLTGMSSEEELSIPTDITTDYKTHKFLDLNRPLFMQVWGGGFSKEFYLQQVHRPRHYKGGESAPLFGNFLEPLSKTPWYMVPILWLPCISYGVWEASKGLPNFGVVAVFFGLGLALWTLVEYGLHRCLFHIDEYVVLMGFFSSELWLIFGAVGKCRIIMWQSRCTSCSTGFTISCRWTSSGLSCRRRCSSRLRHRSGTLHIQCSGLTGILRPACSVVVFSDMCATTLRTTSCTTSRKLLLLPTGPSYWLTPHLDSRHTIKNSRNITSSTTSPTTRRASVSPLRSGIRSLALSCSMAVPRRSRPNRSPVLRTRNEEEKGKT